MTDVYNTRNFLEDYFHIVRKSIAFFVSRIRRSIFSFLLIVLAFTAAGAAYWYRTTPYYESELSCAYSDPRALRKTYGEMAQKLNLLAQSRSGAQIARVLNLPFEQTESIISIDAKNRAGSPLFEDITRERYPVYFTLKATDKAVFLPFQNALVNYLNSDPFGARLRRHALTRLGLEITFLESDISQVDSVIDAYTHALREGYPFKDSADYSFNIRSIFAYKDTLQERVAELYERKNLESEPSLGIIHGFMPADKPSRGSKKVIFAFAILGFLMAMCWAIFRNHKRENNV